MFTNKEKKHASLRKHVSMILVLAMGFTTMISGCGTETKPVETAATVAETEAIVVPVTLNEEDSKSEITQLMKGYFKALKKGDADALGEIMVNAPSQQIIDREIEYIENYKNIKCFTTEGSIENTYAAYVYYNVKFKNIETLAPSMIRVYICKNEEGNLYINNGTVDGEVATWLEEVHNSDAAVALLTDTNAQLTEAASSDEKLQSLVAQLGAATEETVAETTAEVTADETAQSEEETTAGESAEETLAEETTAEETTAAETTQEETTVEETTEAEETTVEETKKASKKNYKEYKKVKILYTEDITNVRKSASSDSKLLGRLNEGKKVKAVGEKDDWYVIKYGSKKGYIKKDLLTSKKPATVIEFKSRDDEVEALQNVRMRKKPSETAKSIGTLPGGTQVTRTGYNKKWTRIVYKGKTVYVATEYVEVVE